MLAFFSPPVILSAVAVYQLFAHENITCFSTPYHYIHAKKFCQGISLFFFAIENVNIKCESFFDFFIFSNMHNKLIVLLCNFYILLFCLLCDADPDPDRLL